MTTIDGHGIPEPLGGRFTDLRFIGAGGSATVYRATDTESSTDIAVKLLRLEASTTMGRVRFDREMRAIREVEHPGILPLIASGVIEEGALRGCPYFAMPFVDGESLRVRLTRERQLSVAEATRIILDILAALSAAHARGVIHRDIKPENILLEGSRVLVADFGIARLTDGSDGLTSSTGVVVGTPRYMSPEQVSGDRTLDHRSDIYSVGILFYELLAGEPPFSGLTAQATFARQMLEPPPSLGIVRPDVSADLVATIETALAKAPAARQGSADAFARAIRDVGQGTRRARAGPWRTWAFAGTGVLLLAAAGTRLFLRSPTPVSASASRLVVFPFVRASPGSATAVEDRVRSALRRWSELSVVDALEMPAGAQPVNDLAEAARAARELGAGLAIVGRIDRRQRDDVVSLSLVDVTGIPAVRRSITITAHDTAGTESMAIDAATDSLLLPNSVRRVTSRVYPAMLAYGGGVSALRAWDLENAARSFAQATKQDASYAEARVWLALVRSWMERPAAEWTYLVTTPTSSDSALTPLDVQRMTALRLQASGDLDRACAAWQALAATNARDYAVWYSLATCLRSDDLVVRAGRSAWRFRSSRQTAVGAYRRALELLPSSHKALSDRSFERVRQLLLTSMTDYVFGRGADGEQFAGIPALAGDSLTLAVIPLRRLMTGRTDALPSTHRQAVMRQRRSFDSLATSWATAFPDSPTALLARAVAYEMSGDARMLTAVDDARRAGGSASDTLLTASVQVRMLVKAGVHRTFLMDTARVLAGDLVRRYAKDSRADPSLVATLAALTGRIHLAAQLLRQRHTGSGSSTPLEIEGQVLMVYAASGAYADSVKAVASRVEGFIGQRAAAEQLSFRLALIGRSATLAWPAAMPATASGLRGKGDYLLDAQLTLDAGDSTAAVRALTDVVVHRTAAPADRTLDAVCPEALVMARAGHASEGSRWLQETISALEVAPPSLFTDAPSGAIVGRCLALAASMAAATGDVAGAARLRDAVRRLWASGDSAVIDLTAHPLR